jgi:hypothetical protein
MRHEDRRMLITLMFIAALSLATLYACNYRAAAAARHRVALVPQPLSAGQGHFEDRAMRIRLSEPQPAAVILDDGPADGKAQSGPGRFRGKEGIEDLVPVGSGDSLAGVLDRQQNG